jgi:hypothetical protein
LVTLLMLSCWFSGSRVRLSDRSLVLAMPGVKADRAGRPLAAAPRPPGHRHGQKRIDLARAGQGGADIADEVVEAVVVAADQIAVALQQPVAVLDLDGDVGAAVAIELQAAVVGHFAQLAAGRRAADLTLDRGGAEALAQHHVHDLLVGRVAVLQGDFLGQDLDALDGLGRHVADLAHAGDSAAVQQHDRIAAQAAGGLGRQLGQQVGDRRDPERAHVGGAEGLFRRDVAHDRAIGFAAGGDGDGLDLGVEVLWRHGLLGGLLRGWGLRGGSGWSRLRIGARRDTTKDAGQSQFAAHQRASPNFRASRLRSCLQVVTAGCQSRNTALQV